jgi:hypothetical protein
MFIGLEQTSGPGSTAARGINQAIAPAALIISRCDVNSRAVAFPHYRQPAGFGGVGSVLRTVEFGCRDSHLYLE